MNRDAREYRRNLAAQALGRFLYVAGGAGICGGFDTSYPAGAGYL